MFTSFHSDLLRQRKSPNETRHHPPHNAKCNSQGSVWFSISHAIGIAVPSVIISPNSIQPCCVAIHPKRHASSITIIYLVDRTVHLLSLWFHDAPTRKIQYQQSSYIASMVPHVRQSRFFSASFVLTIVMPSADEILKETSVTTWLYNERPEHQQLLPSVAPTTRPMYRWSKPPTRDRLVVGVIANDIPRPFLRLPQTLFVPCPSYTRPMLDTTSTTINASNRDCSRTTK